MQLGRYFPLCLVENITFLSSNFRRNTINHLFASSDSRKLTPVMIMKRCRSCSAFNATVFLWSCECPHMCFWFQVMTLPYLYLDKVSIRWNIGCLFYLHTLEKVHLEESCQAFVERGGRQTQLQATHRLWSLHKKRNANERVTVAGCALSSASAKYTNEEVHTDRFDCPWS